MGDIEPMKQSDVQKMLDIMVGGFEFNKTYWPYTKMLAWNAYNEAEKFCYKHFKTRNWRNRGQHFAFKRKEDYEWFVLRWA